MSEENRTHQPHQFGRHRNNRGHRGHRQSHQQGRGGRVQRPLLTSALNGAGLCLVALAVMYKGTAVDVQSQYLGLATLAFVISSLISYFAQRFSSMKWIEKVSDLFFFIGAILMAVVALSLGDIMNYLGV